MVDTYYKKVVFVEATKDFVDTLFSFLSLPLATIVRLLATNNNDQQQQQLPESSPFLENIKNLYQSVQNITSNDVWNNSACTQMLLRPRNPCESMCNELFLNIDDTESTNCAKFLADLHENVDRIKDFRLDLHKGSHTQHWRTGVAVVAIVVATCYDVHAMMCIAAVAAGYRISNIVNTDCNLKPCSTCWILNLLKYALTSHEPLTNTILSRSSRNKCNSPNKSASTVRLMPSIGDNRSKMNIKVLQSKSQKKIITEEAGGDFVDFIFSFLTMPLGSIVKLLGANSFAGCVGNLYKSVENLDPTSVLLNPGISPQFGCPNQPLNIPHANPPLTVYYYVFYRRNVTALDPKVGTVGFVKRARLYGVGDDLKVTPLAANSYLLYLNELTVPFYDLEVKVISIGEAEALSLLGAFLTAKFTFTSGLQDFLNVPKH
ncbi:hypothetical protein TSUD_263190 [Trifolium subterraneum]|nr:hypothetical protein TSUD_263190 [Trifolium subterraneum]